MRNPVSLHQCGSSLCNQGIEITLKMLNYFTRGPEVIPGSTAHRALYERLWDKAYFFRSMTQTPFKQPHLNYIERKFVPEVNELQEPFQYIFSDYNLDKPNTFFLRTSKAIQELFQRGILKNKPTTKCPWHQHYWHWHPAMVNHCNDIRIASL